MPGKYSNVNRKKKFIGIDKIKWNQRVTTFVKKLVINKYNCSSKEIIRQILGRKG
jgi:hypothetical protein